MNKKKSHFYTLKICLSGPTSICVKPFFWVIFHAYLSSADYPTTKSEGYSFGVARPHFLSVRPHFVRPHFLSVWNHISAPIIGQI